MGRQNDGCGSANGGLDRSSEERGQQEFKKDEADSSSFCKNGKEIFWGQEAPIMHAVGRRI